MLLLDINLFRLKYSVLSKRKKDIRIRTLRIKKYMNLFLLSEYYFIFSIDNSYIFSIKFNFKNIQFYFMKSLSADVTIWI